MARLVVFEKQFNGPVQPAHVREQGRTDSGARRLGRRDDQRADQAEFFLRRIRNGDYIIRTLADPLPLREFTHQDPDTSMRRSEPAGFFQF